MDRHNPVLDNYVKFLEQSARIVGHFYFDEDKDFDDVYDIAAKMTNHHFSECADTAELRDILQNGTSYTNTPYGLVMLLFAQTAEDLYISLMEHSLIPKGERIGSVIGIVPPAARIEEPRPGHIKFGGPAV